MYDDMPKIWTDDTPDDETIENAATEILVSDISEAPLPTIAEQKAAVLNSEISEESKGMLNSLVELNSIAQTLSTIRLDETAEQRRTVLNLWCEAFIDARMRNNATAEKLKNALLERLLKNVDELDLATSAEIIQNLHEVSSVDAQQAMSAINGTLGTPSGGNGINLTINNATAEGSQITSNTLNAQPQQVQQLKEVTTLNSSLRAWNNVPLPKKKTVNAEYIEAKSTK